MSALFLLIPNSLTTLAKISHTDRSQSTPMGGVFGRLYKMPYKQGFFSHWLFGTHVAFDVYHIGFRLTCSRFRN